MPQAPLISRRIALGAIAAALTAPHAVLAQSALPAQFPQRPMTLILPFAPAGRSTFSGGCWRRNIRRDPGTSPA
jgi:hypothetical protein